MINLSKLLGVLFIVAGFFTFYDGVLAFGMLYAFKVTGIVKYLAGCIQIGIGFLVFRNKV